MIRNSVGKERQSWWWCFRLQRGRKERTSKVKKEKSAKREKGEEGKAREEGEGGKEREE
jgi:hypothetical protein